MTAPAVVQDPWEEYKRKHGIGQPQAQDTASSDFAAYQAKHGQQEPAADASGFAGAGAGGSTEKVPLLSEGLGATIAQGPTLGFSDELRGALGAPLRSLTKGTSLKDSYTSIRDEERDKLRTYGQDHPIAAPVAETVASLPAALAGGPAGWLKDGMAFGGASGLGHAEGDASSQAQATGLGAALGGLFTQGAKALGKGSSALLDKLNPRRLVRRELATVMPDNARTEFNLRHDLAPGATVPGELGPDASAMATQLGKNRRTAITSKTQVHERIREVRDIRAAVGKEYDALERDLPVDPEIIALSEQAGQPIDPTATTVPFSVVHRLRSDVSRMRAKGMPMHDINVMRDKISTWLSDRVPEVRPVDVQYDALTRHYGDALKGLSAARQGSKDAAKRALSAGSRQGNRFMPSPWHPIQFAKALIEPTPAAKAAALQQVGYTPANAEQEMAKILAERNRITGGGPTPFMGRTGAAALGGMVAPQLSSDTAQASSQATQLRTKGLSNDQLSQQLSSTFTPEVVRFIVAATPQRMAQ